MNAFARQAAHFRNELRQSCAALIGIAQGLLADGQLHDKEIGFLHDWLTNNAAVAVAWPGNVICAQLQTALADGHISEDERNHLFLLLQKLVGGHLDELALPGHVTDLAFDDVNLVHIADRTFCLTGDFCFGTRAACTAAIEARGGSVTASVSKRLDYLVVGGMGSPEWKHGSFGSKIERAMELRASHAQPLIVHEDPWAASLMTQA